jgi:cell division protein FtsW (lipid II flippase)
VLSDVFYRFPWLVLATALVLTLTGIAGIYAATAGDEPPPFWESMAARQLGWLAGALLVFAAALAPSYIRLARASYYLYGASLAVLAVLAFMRRFDLTIPGFIYPIHNTYSWVHIPGTGRPGVNVQPSELTKIAFIMALAYYLRYRKNYRTFRGLLAPFLMALAPTALVLYAADLGTAMLFLPVLFLMLFAAGARTRHLVLIILMGILMVPVFYSSLKGYQRLRIDSWLLQGSAERLHFALLEGEPPEKEGAEEPSDEKHSEDAQPEAERNDEDKGAPTVAAPRARLTDERKTELVRQITSTWRFRLWRLASRAALAHDKTDFALARDQLFEALDTQGYSPRSFDTLRGFFGILLAGPGHQSWQAKIAIGSGGLFGRGWLQGTQTRHRLLPEAHTDFLFPTMAEQFGLWGAGLIVLLYGLLGLFGVDVSFSTTEPYGKLFVVGVVGLFEVQAFLNISMSVGLTPITGIPLPLMSYGGSSLLSSFLALGLLCNVGARRLFLIAPSPFEWHD